LPSDTYDILLKRLAAATGRVHAALGQNDPGCLEGLLARHREIMTHLARQGTVQDPALAAPLATLKAQVDQVSLELKDRLEKTAARLAGNVNRRKLARTYGRERLQPG
jgi:hypothetical protein